MLRKQVILRIKNVYTANAFVDGARSLVGAGSETEAVVQLYDLASGKVEHLDSCPGGMMSLVPVPGQPGQLVSVMGLFPPFIGKDAGLTVQGQRERIDWRAKQVFKTLLKIKMDFKPIQTLMIN